MAIKQNNFYQRWTLAAKADKIAANRRRMRVVVPVAAFLGVCAAAWGTIFAHTAMLNTRADAIWDWINQPSINEPYLQSLSDQLTAQTNRNRTALAQNIWNLLDTYPGVTSDTLNRIEAAGNASITIRFTSYNAATGLLAFEARSSQVIDIPAYVRSLQNTGVFANVGYTGYGFNSDGTYTINLSCTLAAPQQEG